MSIDRIPPFGKAPKPKSKGKKMKPEKKKLPPKIKPLDVFKVAQNANAGSDSSSSRDDFDHLMRSLSKSQLGRIEALVQDIQNRTFEDMDEREKDLAACKKIEDAIHTRSEKSTEIEASISLQIKEKLDSIQFSAIQKSSSGNVKRVRRRNRWISIPTLIKRYFQRERRVIRKALDQGMLIRAARKQKARAYLADKICEYLQEKES